VDAPRLAACVFLLATAAACSSKQDANKANFAEAVTAGLASGPSMCKIVTLPVWPDDEPDSSDNTQQMQTLVKAGFLQSEPITIGVGPGRLGPGHRYRLTAEGAKYMKDGRLCYGKANLVKILNWEPVQTVAGMGSTRVYFTYSIDGLPDWAKRQDIQAAFPDVRAVIQGQENRKMVMPLILVDGHWQKE
jgi:hypothetical protein